MDFYLRSSKQGNAGAVVPAEKIAPKNREAPNSKSENGMKGSQADQKCRARKEVLSTRRTITRAQCSRKVQTRSRNLN